FAGIFDGKRGSNVVRSFSGCLRGCRPPIKRRLDRGSSSKRLRMAQLQWLQADVFAMQHNTRIHGFLQNGCTPNAATLLRSSLAGTSCEGVNGWGNDRDCGQLANLNNRLYVCVVRYITLQLGRMRQKCLSERLHRLARESANCPKGRRLFRRCATHANFDRDSHERGGQQLGGHRHVDLHVVVGIKMAAGFIRIENADLDHGFPLRRTQYFCTLGSISSLHARIPPARFTTLGYPACLSNSAMRCERAPLRQCTTTSRSRSISARRCGTSFWGISFPPIWA